MDRYKIAVTFRPGMYAHRYVEPGTVIKGILEIAAKRCDVESILAEMNVFAYQIIDCDHHVQIMHSMKKIPEFYYEKEE